jgi:hypothetical protein
LIRPGSSARGSGSDNLANPALKLPLVVALHPVLLATNTSWSS